MNILIVGASGLVGSHCLTYLKSQGLNVIGTHRNYSTPETIFFDPELEQSFDMLDKLNIKMDIIIHCGALTHVDYCEENTEESYHQTVISTARLSAFSAKRGIKLIYLSTDYIFNGRSGPYIEDSPTDPINIYGSHKLMAEKIVEKLEKHLILRITNVYGEETRSKNFVAALINAIHTDVPRTFNLAFDQFATPIYAGDIARMIYLLINDNKGGIYNFSSTDYYSRFQLAKKIVSLFKKNSKLEIIGVPTSTLINKANRPLNGGLLNNKFSLEYPQFQFTNIDKFILDTYKNYV